MISYSIINNVVDVSVNVRVIKQTNSNMNLENKVVLITGAGSGIGAATATVFANEGAHVVAVEINEERVKDIRTKLGSIDKKLLVIKADVTKDEEAQTIIKQTIERFGRLDVLVNNAGILRLGSILDVKVLNAYDEMVSINLRAIILLTTLAAPHLIASKGNVVIISSAVSRSSCPPNFLAYSVTKAAVEHFTRGAALELAPLGVRINSVHPGPVRTNIIDQNDVMWQSFLESTLFKRISAPEEIGDFISYLASEKAKSITGSAFVCDNGYGLTH